MWVEFGRRVRVLAMVCWMSAGVAQAHAGSKPPVITTWWPDPATGLMWSGGDLGSTGAGFTHAQAVQACAGLQLAGHSDWRLPTPNELKAAMSEKTYEVYDTETGMHDGKTWTKTTDEGAATAPGMTFESGPERDVWTSEATDATHFTAYLSSTEKFGPIPYKGSVDNTASTYCVRTMDANLRSIAEAAHATAPVQSIEVLKDIAILYAVEQVFDPGDTMTAAVAKAHAVAAGDKVMAVRADMDAGFLEVLEGEWAAAKADLAKARAGEKNNSSVKADIAWEKIVEREAATEPKTTEIWAALKKEDSAYNRQQWPEAEADANAAIALAPGWSDGYARLGVALGKQNQWADALAAFEKGSTLRNDSKIDFKANIKWAKKGEKQAAKSAKHA